MNARDEACDHRRAAQRWLLAAAILAGASLPVAEISWPWMLALLLPAGIVAAVPGADRRPVVRALSLTILQVAACLAAIEVHGSLPRPLALAATLLPPLAFVAVRRGDSDRALGAFLSLCVLVVGAILEPIATWHVIAFAFAAAAQLRHDARIRVLELCGDAPTVPLPVSVRRSTRTATLASSLTIAVLVLTVQEALLRLPPPSLLQRPESAVTERTPIRSAGLSDSFELGGDGVLSNLRGDLLVSVRCDDRRNTPKDLYLRSGFFQTPGLDAWQVGPLTQVAADSTSRPFVLRPPPRGSDSVRLQVSRTPAARDLVFVAPGTCSILGIPDLACDPAREWFRQSSPGHLDDYELVVADSLASIDTRTTRRELLTLPAAFDARWFAPLLEGLPAGADALTIAQHVGSVLQQRCRYERREPGGPHRHALLNFLHGERIGYCMHFASAAAILLRMRGVPCRIGVGLYGGESGDRGSRRFGSQHAHAWVELPLAGGGYGVFDPTPPALRGTVPQLPENPGAETPAAEADAGPSLLERAGTVLREHWPFFVLALAALGFVVRPRRIPAARATAPRAARPARKLLMTLLAELERRGHARRGSTIEQFAASLRASGAAAPALERAFEAYQEVRFGGRAFDSERERRMREGLACARELPHPEPPAQA